MPDPLPIRLTTGDDESALLDLFQHSFGRSIPEPVWRWLGLESPAGGNRSYVAEEAESRRMVASYSLLPIKLRLNGDVVRASLANNASTHPDYRGRGLFTWMGRHVLDLEREFETPITIGMPNPSALPGHRKVGWEVICDLPFLVKTDCRKRAHRCTEVAAFDETFDDLFNRLSERFTFLVVKDHRFMNWRVVSRPEQRYTRFVLQDGKRIRGYVVLKHFDDKDGLKSHILDLHAENDDALHELVAAAENFAVGRDELNLWTNRNDPYRTGMLEHEFFERPGSDMLIMHTNYGERRAPVEGGWSICLADNDVY